MSDLRTPTHSMNSKDRVEASKGDMVCNCGNASCYVSSGCCLVLPHKNI